MAIYDSGTASLAANGAVTGVGTTWMAPLTLIRVGATIVFKTEPVNIYTISEIISDTQINVYNPKSETIPAGTGYAILAHDGITVQGLAQDVAETLRYYQSNNYVSADQDGNVGLGNGGTGASTPSKARENLQVPAISDVLLKNDNLASLSNRDQAWLNVRPTGPTNLSANPVGPLDAATKQWVEALRSVNDSWTVSKVDATSPPAATVVTGGAIISDYKIGTTSTYRATLQSYGTIGGTALQQGARISTNGMSYDFTNNGTLFFPNASMQIGTRRPLGDLTVDAYLRPRDCYARPTESLGVSAVENNTISIRNFQASANSYVSWLRGDWYNGSYILGGIRGSSTLLEKFTIAVDSGGAGSASFDFYPSGVAQCTTWQSTSDERLKTNIRRIEQPLDKMRKIKGVTWERMDVNPTPAGIGFIAQDVETAFPDYVNVLGSRTITLKDGTVVGNIKSLDTGGIAAALHHEAILALMDKINALESEILDIKSTHK